MTERLRDDGEDAGRRWDDVPHGGAGAVPPPKRTFQRVLQMLNLQLDVEKEAEGFHNYDSEHFEDDNEAVFQYLSRRNELAMKQIQKRKKLNVWHLELLEFDIS